MAKEQKLTPWFPQNVRPARPGVYETREPNGLRFFNLYRKGTWHFGSTNVDDAAVVEEWHGMSLFEEGQFLKKWRGLAQDPSKEPK